MRHSNLKGFFVLMALTFTWLVSLVAFAAEGSGVQTVNLPFELSKFEGSEQIARKVQKFAELEFARTLKARGQVVQIAYRLPAGNSPLEILENYKQNLSAQSFSSFKESLINSRAEASGDWRSIILKRSEANGESVIEVEAYTVKNSWRAGAKREFFGESIALNPDDVIVTVQIVAPKALEQKMVKEEVSYILNQLSSQGRVALYGIYFDTDKTEIKPESDTVLNEVSKAMSQDPALRLKVIGHTDNTGEAEHNKRLSKGRAKAVVDAIIAHGIDQSRLLAEGSGDSQPIASNETETGRAKNRRVELVKLS